MQRPEPELTSLAWDDLDTLFDTILETSGSAAIAESIYSGILSTVESAASFPNASPSVQGRLGIPCDYRWVSHKGWLAFYHVKPDGGILVDRVLWGRSEWANLLGLSNEGTGGPQTM